MIKEIRFSEEFDRAFKRLKKRYRSLPDDVKKLLASLIVSTFLFNRSYLIIFSDTISSASYPKELP